MEPRSSCVSGPKAMLSVGQAGTVWRGLSPPLRLKRPTVAWQT